MTRVPIETKWSEAKVARALVRQVFNNAVLAVPNCCWTGSECDLLVIDKKSLRIIDVEVKISRADLKADAGKDKWWVHRPWSRRKASPAPRQWPDKVWKHYYALPASIWDDKLFADINPCSGVLAIAGTEKAPIVEVLRQAKPCRDAKPITSADAIDIARLANLRMWAALEQET